MQLSVKTLDFSRLYNAKHCSSWFCKWLFQLWCSVTTCWCMWMIVRRQIAAYDINIQMNSTAHANTGGSQTLSKSIVLITCLYSGPKPNRCPWKCQNPHRTVINANLCYHTLTACSFGLCAYVWMCLPSLAGSGEATGESSAFSRSLMCSVSWHVLLCTFSCQRYPSQTSWGRCDPARPGLADQCGFEAGEVYEWEVLLCHGWLTAFKSLHYKCS